MPSSNRLPRRLALAAASLALVATQAGTAAAQPGTTLVPIGSDYQPDTLELFANEAAGRDTNGTVHILVLPITYSLSADSTTKSERKKNLTLADNRRGQVEAACNAVRGAGQTCDVDLVPVLVRSDAVAFTDTGDWFEADLDGMYVLGGDQTVAMNAVHDTPLEAAMTAAFEAGAVFSGNSAGDAVQSTDMINGYTGSNGPAESLRQGAVELCRDSGPTTCQGGMPFGFSELITDQHVFEYGRTGRSINVAVTSGKPVLGMDAATGAVVTDETILRDVTGDTLGYVIDPTAYGSTAAFGGPNSSLRTHAVAVHLLPAGAGFDFSTMTPSQGGVAQPKPVLGVRAYPAITTASTRPLYLAGGIVGAPSAGVTAAFVADAGGSSARILVVAGGYAKNADARADAKAIAASLAPSVAAATWLTIDGTGLDSAEAGALAAATGVIVTGEDRSRIGAALNGPEWTAIRSQFLAGEFTLLADDAAAAAAGSTYIAAPIVPDVEAGAIEDAIGTPATGTGYGLASGVTVEPRLLPDQHWPQLFQLARAEPVAIALGIDVGTAVRVTSAGAPTVVGGSAVVAVDSSEATFATGDNDAIGASWLLLDTFASGDAVAP
jgi:cyanophycinase-like exopeptidase